MRFFKNRVLTALAAVAVVTAVLAGISKTGNNPVTNFLNTLSTPVQNIFATVLRPINEYMILIDEMEGYKKENERLIREITELKRENRDSENYITENNRLKELLDIKEKNVGLKTTAAKVVSKDYEKWYKGITLNKGENSGIKEGDPVITQDGILGVIESVGSNWAKVTTVYDYRSAIGARFTRTGDVGIVEGDAELADVGKCKIEYISSSASIINGDILVSSGLGDVFPEGLMIGKVSEVKVDAVGGIEYAVVEPSVDFDSVYEVLVITDFKDKEDVKDNGDSNE